MRKQVTTKPFYRKQFVGFLRIIVIVTLLLQVTGMVKAQAPTITSFIPNAGPVGTLVTITGTNLGSQTAFTIGGVNAIQVSNNGATLVGMVMPGAATGSVSVTTGGGTVIAAGSFTVTATPYPSVQQGDKLVGTGTVGAAGLGYSVAVSADGNTAIIGGYSDNSGQGAAWIYTRSGNTWSQQGDKLVGAGNTGAARQGTSVAISADGNTAIVGGSNDNSGLGAVWVFTRSGTTWSQQGSKLVGTGNAGNSQQGCSVAVSADGNTAIIGGMNDNSQVGAAWVFTRSGNNWSQQGNKLSGAGAVNVGFAHVRQGLSVSLSSDGNTAIVGGPYDNDGAGAAWIFTRTGEIWSQQGSKLYAPTDNGGEGEGRSVALSADGNTAMVGGIYYTDPSTYDSPGAAWVFTRLGGAWSQQAGPLTGTGYVGMSWQGQSVGLSADGNTAIIGGNSDNSDFGATWVFTRSGSTWTQQGAKLVGTGSTGVASQGYSAALSADGKTVIVGGLNDNNFMGAAWVFGISAVTWTGAVSSDWNTAGNWSNNAVPGTTFDMIIANTANSPVISQGTGTPAECHNLTINSGAVLTIGAGKALTVNGDIISYAGNSGLVIQSDATGTGSLLHNTVEVPATLNRYITGSAILTDYKYHLVSVPLVPASTSTANLFLGSYLYDFNVGTNAWNSLGTSTNTVLDETKGYMLYYPGASTTYSFGGNMNAGSFTPAVINAGSGFNLVPNPYPSAIDWDDADWTKTNIGGSIWIWSATNGNYAAYNTVSGGTNNGTKYIPAEQAFFVQATGAAPALVMNDQIRVHNSQAFWKSATNLPDRLSIKVASNGYSDEAVVRFDDEATLYADPQSDAAKMPGLDSAPQLYTLTTDNKQLSINSLPHSNSSVTVPLNFELKADKSATLTISGVENFSPGATIYLEDKLTNTTINLRKQGVYTFSHLQANAAGRFELRFNGATGADDLNAGYIRIWAGDQAVNISAPALTGKNALVEIISLSGQSVFSRQMTLGDLTKVPVNLSGIYIIRVTSSDETLVTKAIFK